MSYICGKYNKVDVMNNCIDCRSETSRVMYVNQFANIFYNANEILDLNLKSSASANSPIDTIFNLYCRILTRSEEQRLVFYHLTYDKESYTISKLIKLLSDKYNKSERTYRRAIDYLIRRKIIGIRNNILEIKLEYNLSVLDLDNIKGIMIHII